MNWGNRQKLWDAWRSHKNVVHVAAAYRAMHDMMGSDWPPEKSGGCLDFFVHLGADLVVAGRFFQEFGLGFVQKHGKQKSLLDPDKIWRFPEAVPLVDHLFAAGGLFGNAVQSLKNRKAYRRY